ncbi:MAG TPA: MFS transporter [Actinomycetota bacterium]|nr:MFS transporter [Actinomycetota bacterium]
MRVRTTGAAAGGPAVRRLAAGLLLSRTGDQLTTIALVWFVLDLTGSGVAVGLVLLCAGLPPVVTGPLLDRWPLRRVMVADNLARATLVGAIPTLHWLGRLDMPLVCGLSVAAGALVPATDVGVRVALPRLVEEADLERANLLLSVGDQVSALAGPALGGLLVGLVGAPPVLLADAASFLAMAALVGPLPDAAGPAVPPPATGPATRAPLADPTVRTVLGLTLVYFLAYGPLEPALPLYSRDVLQAGAGGYGLLWSAFGAGALAGLATVPAVGRLRPGLALAGNAVAWGAALLPLLAIAGIVPAMATLALGGLVWAPYVTLESSLLQRVVPAPALGRVFGVRRALTAAAMPLGAAAGGLLLQRAAPTAVIGLSAVTCMLAGAAALCSPALHRLPARRA